MSDFSPELWARAQTGDRDAYESAVAPYQDALMTAARRQVDVARATGDLAETALTPEELVGETLVRAYDLRDRYDADAMGMRAWLLGLQTRSLARLRRADALYAERKAISLDAPVPTGEDQDAVGESFFEFRQPYDVTTYEELFAGSAPADVELSQDRLAEARLSDRERDALADAELSAEGRDAVLLHDEFELSLAETAQILDASLKDTAEAVNAARVTLRQRLGSTEDLAGDDPTTDSYTGDAI